jgi:hypothetical protein
MPSLAPLSDIADYHNDAEFGLRLCFSRISPAFEQRFSGSLGSEIVEELEERLEETDLRSSLITLARLEAALRRNYRDRCREKGADDVSIAFRKMHKKYGDRVRLDDILEVWSAQRPYPLRQAIGELRRMFRFRHWLAHGRHWNADKKHDFADVYATVEAVLTDLELG